MRRPSRRPSPRRCRRCLIRDPAERRIKREGRGDDNGGTAEELLNHEWMLEAEDAQSELDALSDGGAEQAAADAAEQKALLRAQKAAEMFLGNLSNGLLRVYFRRLWKFCDQRQKEKEKAARDRDDKIAQVLLVMSKTGLLHIYYKRLELYYHAGKNRRQEEQFEKYRGALRNQAATHQGNWFSKQSPEHEGGGEPVITVGDADGREGDVITPENSPKSEAFAQDPGKTPPRRGLLSQGSMRKSR
eukprot:gene427-8880_t